jgi:hypothetical protein
MSVNSFKVGALSSAVLSTDDLSALVGLHTYQCLIVLRRQDLGSSRQLHDGTLGQRSFELQRMRGRREDRLREVG